MLPLIRQLFPGPLKQRNRLGFRLFLIRQIADHVRQFPGILTEHFEVKVLKDAGQFIQFVCILERVNNFIEIVPRQLRIFLERNFEMFYRFFVFSLVH